MLVKGTKKWQSHHQHTFKYNPQPALEKLRSCQGSPRLCDLAFVPVFMRQLIPPHVIPDMTWVRINTAPQTRVNLCLPLESAGMALVTTCKHNNMQHHTHKKLCL